MDLIGHRIGHLRIDALLGEGGMGRVWRGFDEKLQRPVAVKTLHSRGGHALASGARARFLQEARILSQLNHPAICQVYDLVEGDGADYLVLELVEGRTLRRAAADPSLDLAARLDVAEAAIEAIAAAHRVGIVHRDLKPDNLMLTRNGQVKILDFGIARAALEGPRADEPAIEIGAEPVSVAGDLDRTLQILPPSPASPRRGGDASLGTGSDRPAEGTLRYMSPEQARGEPVGLASDLYSLGIVLQEFLTGRRAVPHLPQAEQAERARRGETASPEGLDPELAALLDDLKRPEPERRPTSDEALARLRAYRGRPERRRRRRRLAAAGLAAGLAVAALVGWAILGERRTRREAGLAQQFAGSAAEIEAMLHFAHLAPVHDLRPTLTEARERSARLRAEMERLRMVERAPGEAALGRVALALEDWDEARIRLEAAWRADYRPPEVATALGLALSEVYRRELSRARRIDDETARRAEMERLDRTLRSPALEVLAVGRRALAAAPSGTTAAAARFRRPTESLAYVEALAAVSAERYDEALARAEASVAEAPLLFEGHLLVAKIQRALGEQRESLGDYTAATAAFTAARAALERAAEVGRSHPGVHLERCALSAGQVPMELYQAPEPEPDPLLADGRAACRTLLELDPDHVGARALLAELGLREAESLGEGEEARAALAAAAALAGEALARDRDRPQTWRILGHIEMVQADWYVYDDNHDEAEAAPFVARANAAYREAVRLAPDDSTMHNALANSHALAAAIATELGEDPRSEAERSEIAYRRAIELAPDDFMARGNLILLLGDRARWELDRGLDPRPTLAAAEREQSQIETRIPDSPLGAGNLAEICLLAAEYELDNGIDPGPRLERARQLALQGLARRPNQTTEKLALVTAGRLAAAAALAAGRDPAAQLAQTLRQLARLTEHEARPGTVALETAETHRIEALALRARGGDPRPALARATAPLDALIGRSGSHPAARLARSRVALVEGLAAADRGGDPEPAFRRASAELAAVRARRPLRSPVERVAAQLAVARAEFAVAQGRSPAAEIAEGRARLARLAELRPGLAEADAWAARLDLAEAAAAIDPAEREELRRRGEAALERALAANPFLRGEHGVLLGK